jgi:hypothetical protein
MDTVAHIVNILHTLIFCSPTMVKVVVVCVHDISITACIFTNEGHILAIDPCTSQDQLSGGPELKIFISWSGTRSTKRWPLHFEIGCPWYSSSHSQGYPITTLEPVIAGLSLSRESWRARISASSALRRRICNPNRFFLRLAHSQNRCWMQRLSHCC